MFRFLFNKHSNNPAAKPRKDPVCGMRASDAITYEYQGQIYAFCSEYCRQEFAKNPEQYLGTQ